MEAHAKTRVRSENISVILRVLKMIAYLGGQFDHLISGGSRLRCRLQFRKLLFELSIVVLEMLQLQL